MKIPLIFIKKYRMKKLIVIILLGFSILPCQSQISIRKETNKDFYQKPPVYDSLGVNFESFLGADVYKYLQYIGHKIYFKPLSDKVKKDFNFEDFIVSKDTTLRGEILVPFEKTNLGVALKANLAQKAKSEEKYNNSFNFKTNLYKPIFTRYAHEGYDGMNVRIGTNPELLENKTFLILDIFFGQNIKTKKALTAENATGREDLLLMLADEKGDTLYWKTFIRKIAGENRVIIQGFYDKQVAYYKNKPLVYRQSIPHHYIIYGDRKEKNDYEKIIASHASLRKDDYFTDINSRQQIKVENLSNWTCSDVTLIEEDGFYDLFYILQNESGNEIKVPAKKMAESGFFFKESYDKEMDYRKMKAEELEMIRQKQEQAQMQYLAARKQNLISKYGQKNGELISEGKVALGMTKNMCADAWGETTSIIQNNSLEVWVYCYRNSLYFRGNTLIQIVNLH